MNSYSRQIHQIAIEKCFLPGVDYLTGSLKSQIPATFAKTAWQLPQMTWVGVVKVKFSAAQPGHRNKPATEA
jgi:hypothetical protein